MIDGEQEEVYEDDETYEDGEEEYEYADEPDEAEWTVGYVAGLAALDQKLGRRITQREQAAIAERLEVADDPFPLVEAAYQDYYESDPNLKPPDLSTSAGRTAYMAERLREQQREDVQG